MDTKRYWETNISRWGKFYLERSHHDEAIDARWPLSWLYRRCIMPIESKLMQQRYAVTRNTLDERIGHGTRACDIGCGTGVFTAVMLDLGAEVQAVDIAQSALDLTAETVAQSIPDRAEHVTYVLKDVRETPIEECDFCLVMGVTPYIADIDRFYENTLPYTQGMYVLYVDPKHWINVVRRAMPFLNVRHLQMFDKAYTEKRTREHGFRIVDRSNFATGYLDLIERDA